MSIEAIVWVFRYSESKLGARLVLLTLADYAHDDGTKAFPAVATIARKSRLSERAVQDALRKLTEAGEIQCTGRTKAGVNIYRIVGIGEDDDAGGADFSPRGADPAPDPTDLPVKDPPEHLVVIEAWRVGAPTLTAHRDELYKSDRMRRAVRAALKVYDAPTIAEAISLYATCLGSDEYRWSYRWTLIDFLKRGLDRFVPEAQPLERERVRSAREDAGRSRDHIADI